MKMMVEEVLREEIPIHIATLDLILPEEMTFNVEVELTPKLEYLVYEIERSVGIPVLASYRLISTGNSKCQELGWALRDCNLLHDMIAKYVSRLMDGCAIYKALDWT